MNTKHFGNIAEEVVVGFLKKRGYEIIDRNYRFCGGEIDIIAYEKNVKELVFVEVRSKWVRSIFDFSNSEILPEDSVNIWKIKKIEKTIFRFLNQEALLWEPFFRDIEPYAFPEWRIDLLSVVIIRELKKAKIRHYKYIYA